MFLSRHWLYVTGTLSGLLLRLCYLAAYSRTDSPDTILYADIARTWLAHGVYGTLDIHQMPVPTDIRMPGYPAVLAVLFFLFGDSQYLPVLLLQIGVDLIGCFVIAAITRSLFGEGPARAAFVLAAFCPFTANYAAIALTETLSIFFTALALLLGIKGIRAWAGEDKGVTSAWACSGFAIGVATLLRPDGILLLLATLLFLFLTFAITPLKQLALKAALTSSLAMVLVLSPWIWRNAEVFGEFQPLAPRYAMSANEYVPSGFYRWFKSLAVDYSTLLDIFWRVSSEHDGKPVELAELPYAQFHDSQEREATVELFRRYNTALILTPELDKQFAALAERRIAEDPLRYYALLPVLRMADMWFRPRTEFLVTEQHWWRMPLSELLFSGIYAGLNLVLVISACTGMWHYRRLSEAKFVISFVMLRTLFLATIENPEPRYVLECFPVVIAFAGVLFYDLLHKWKPQTFTVADSGVRHADVIGYRH